MPSDLLRLLVLQPQLIVLIWPTLGKIYYLVGYFAKYQSYIWHQSLTVRCIVKLYKVHRMLAVYGHFCISN